MIAQELFDMVKEYNNGDVKETIQSVVELLGNIRNDVDKYTMELDIINEEFANDNEACCTCGSELVFIPSYEQEEYQGSPVGINICPNC